MPYSARSDSIGSSRAARCAGSTPESTPVPRLAPIASTTNRIGVRTGMPGTRSRRSWQIASAPISPIDAAQRRERAGLGQEDEPHLAAGGADRAHQADLAGALADRDPHHGEDPDRAHQDRDGGDAGDAGGDDAHHVVEGVEHRLLAGDGDVLLAVALDHQRADRLLDLLRRGRRAGSVASISETSSRLKIFIAVAIGM